MKIDVRHIARLAKLSIDEDQIPRFEKQMGDILGMVEKLPPLSGSFQADSGNIMVLRPDVIGKSLSRDELLQNAPQRQAGCIVVPKTVG